MRTIAAITLSSPFFSGLALALLCIALPALANGPRVVDTVSQQDVTIWSQGVRLSGSVFKPKNLDPGAKLPGILLVHGWGGKKAHLNKAYAPQFAELGFIVLTFDFKGWGESNGPLLYEHALAASEEKTEVSVDAQHMRKMVHPPSMLADTRAALNFLAGEPQVLANKLGIWGTSLGGGLALVTAANDQRIKAYVDQIGAVNFGANLSMITDEMTQRWEIQRARGDIPPYSGPESVINPALKGYPDWIHLKAFDSFASVGALKVPTLIIDAEDEELFARKINGELLYNTIKDRLETKYVVYPGKHYDIYSGKQYLGALNDAEQWFVKHLKSDERAANLYKTHCAACHSNPVAKAPSLSAVRAMTYEHLLGTMNNGAMQLQSSAMNDEERQTLAKYLSQSSEDPRAWEAAMACSTTANVEKNVNTSPASVSGWGYGPRNHRYQNAAHAGITAADLGNLELAWAQGFPGVSSMRAQPIIRGNVLYVGVAEASAVYAFQLDSGCLQWAYHTPAPVRSSLAFGYLHDTDQAVLSVGDGRGGVHLINANNGAKLWSSSAAIGSASTITGTPVIHEGKLIVPISSMEVARASMGQYECCKDHGGVRAFDLNTGEVLWTYHSTEQASPRKKNAMGSQTWGPSGAPVWTTPAIDAKRNRLYIGTGENYSWPSSATSDAIIALNLDTGEADWVFQALKDDVYVHACVGGYLGYPVQPTCPENPGPDFDFGASVIIATDDDGNEILLAGQKSGDVYALNPDKKGKLIWQTNLSDGTPVGGIHWGMSLEGNTLFVPLADPEWNITKWEYTPKPGVAALNINDGTIKWRHTATRGCELDKTKTDPINGRQEEKWPGCPFAYGYSGAATSIQGAVLVGALNGKLSAFSSSEGELLWQLDTKKPYATLNGISAHGGAMDNAGPAVGNGYMVIQSGYSYFNQMPGNVLLVLKKSKD